MSRSVIAYDRNLPEIPGRLSWEPPTSHLVRTTARPAVTGPDWRVEPGRRTSDLLIIANLRARVDLWRASGYPGASEVSRRLFEYWFEDDHQVSGFPGTFRYHFGQREAIETLIYVVECAQLRDVRALLEAYATAPKHGLLVAPIEYQTLTDGRRQLRRFFPETKTIGVQDLPPENLARYAFKMATGSGKTWVMAMAIVWSHFHKRYVPGSPLSTNFLVVAPNVIVYQRLERDFGSNRIFHHLPLVPPEWGGWYQKVILRGESTAPDPSANLILTNIQQLYEARSQEWTPANAIEALLGPKPAQNLAAYTPSLLDRLKALPDLVTINDEAHHVHDAGLAWSQSLLTLHNNLPGGLSLWLDFSATPKDQGGRYYPWSIVDYPLAQAVEDRIVKAPIIVTREDDARHPAHDPEGVTKDNVGEKYGFWFHAAVERWRAHYQVYQALPDRPKPVLFIMAEKNAFADTIGRYLWQTKEFGLTEAEVLVIHTDTSGEVTKGDLDKARLAANEIDHPTNPYKVIVSVMMLREGWDVRNVTVVLGLRPFTADAQILPEQVIGRGLRLMPGIGPDRTQSLEVLGTRRLLELLRTQLETDGVGHTVTKGPPDPPVQIAPIREKIAHDIAIPITKPSLVHNLLNLSKLNVSALAPLSKEISLDSALKQRLVLEFATVKTTIGIIDLAEGDLPIAQELLASITNKVAASAHLANVFRDLYPLVRSYIADRCFDTSVDLDSPQVRAFLRELSVQEAIARYLANQIARLIVETRPLTFANASYKLSDTKPFGWRRNLPPPICVKTIFNYVATYNPFEARFAQFLDAAPDIRRFAALGTTEQGDSGTQFKVDYLKPTGAIGFYFPDWVAVQTTPTGDIHWILETKGRVWESTPAKDDAITDWCARVSAQTGVTWQFARVNQPDFDSRKPKSLAAAVANDQSTLP